MHDATPPPLELRPRPSPRLAAFVILTHVGALAAAAVLALPWAARAVLLVLIAANLAYLLLVRVLYLAPWSLQRARWDAHGWELGWRSGRTEPARLLPGSYLGVGLVILNFACGHWRRTSLVLTADAIDADLLRRLRARLRLAGRAGDAAPP